jgi:hypothetical protein
MKNQRWPGDDQTIGQEFRSSRREEDMGMAGINASFGNDFLAMGMTRRLDMYETDELQPSWTTQLDTNGMQPHAREYLERDLLAMRSGRKFTTVDGGVIDHCDGIQFSGTP